MKLKRNIKKVYERLLRPDKDDDGKGGIGGYELDQRKIRMQEKVIFIPIPIPIPIPCSFCSSRSCLKGSYGIFVFDVPFVLACRLGFSFVKYASQTMNNLSSANGAIKKCLSTLSCRSHLFFFFCLSCLVLSCLSVCLFFISSKAMTQYFTFKEDGLPVIVVDSDFFTDIFEPRRRLRPTAKERKPNALKVRYGHCQVFII
jgi:hypothetical protein